MTRFVARQVLTWALTVAFPRVTGSKPSYQTLQRLDARNTSTGSDRARPVSEDEVMCEGGSNPPIGLRQIDYSNCHAFGPPGAGC